jgi:hypothetical protein
MFNETCWRSILQNLDNFCQFILLPFFALDNEEIQNIEADPPSFVNSVYAFSLDGSDSRAYIYHFLISKVQKSSELLQSMYSLLENYLSQISVEESPETFFSIMHFFSSAARQFTQQNFEIANQFIQSISLYLGSNSCLIQSAVLKCFESMKLPSPLIIHCSLQLIESPSKLVRYHAALALSSSLSSFMNSSASIGLSPEIVVSIVQRFVELSAEFHDPSFDKSLKSVISFFGVDLKAACKEVAEKFFDFFLLLSRNEGCVENAKLVLEMISVFFNSVRGDDQFLSFSLEPFFVTSLELLDEFPEHFVPDIIEFCAHLIAFSSTISPRFWEAIRLIPQFQYQKGFRSHLASCLLFSNLVIRDPDMAVQECETLTNYIFQIMDFLKEDQICSSLDFLGNLFYAAQKISNLHPIFTIIIQFLQNPKISSSASNLCAMMLIISFENLKDLFFSNDFFIHWISSCSLQHLMALLYYLHNHIRDEEKIQILSLIFNKISNENQDKSAIAEQCTDLSNLSSDDASCLSHFSSEKFLQFLKNYLKQIQNSSVFDGTQQFFEISLQDIITQSNDLDNYLLSCQSLS